MMVVAEGTLLHNNGVTTGGGTTIKDALHSCKVRLLWKSPDAGDAVLAYACYCDVACQVLSCGTSRLRTCCHRKTCGGVGHGVAVAPF